MKSLITLAATLIACIVLVFSAVFSYKIINIRGAYASMDSQQQIDIANLVNYRYSHMTEHQRKGTMLLVSIPDQQLSQSTVDFLKTNKISGVVLLGNNIHNESQLKQLTADLRTKVDPNILIAIDQEGGTVTRIKWDKYAAVSAKDIGDKNDEQYAYEVAFNRARMLKELGINVLLGPVADISSGSSSFMHSRCFGTDIEKVSKYVEITVKAQKDAGIITVLKHFPGHGNTTIDSHFSFPVIRSSKEALMQGDFKPFKAGIDAGAEIVMLGHIINPNISPQISSMSAEYVAILEQELGFKGLVMTDDLRMTGQIKGANPLALNIIIDSQANIGKRIGEFQINEEATKEVLLFKYTQSTL